MNISLNLINSGSKAATPVDGNQTRVTEQTNSNGFKNLLVSNINDSQQNSNINNEKLKEDSSNNNSNINRRLSNKKIDSGNINNNTTKKIKLLNKGKAKNAESTVKGESKLRKEIEDLTRELSENDQNDRRTY